MIRNFIIKNDGKVTKNDVVRHMTEYSSRAPTLDMIDEFESAGLIEVLRGNRRGQPHYLKINIKNEYNRISKELSKIEKIVDAMDEPVERIMSLGQPDMIRKIPERWNIRKLHDDFLGEYYDSMDNILDVLLFYTTNKVHSEKEAWSLYTKIIKLKAKVNEQMTIFQANGIEHLFLSSKVLLRSSLRKLKDFDQDDLDYAKKKGININLLADLKEKIETYKKEFLGE
jgi:hypothetical protein